MTSVHIGCPHCGKEHFVPEVAWLNEEHYGNRCHTIACIHCGGIVDVAMRRVVVVSAAHKSSRKHSNYCQWEDIA